MIKINPFSILFLLELVTMYVAVLIPDLLQGGQVPALVALSALTAFVAVGYEAYLMDVKEKNCPDWRSK